MSDYSYNVIPIKILNSKIFIDIKSEKTEGYSYIFPDELGNIGITTQQISGSYYRLNDNKNEDGVEISLDSIPRIFITYLNRLTFDYFSSKFFPISESFIRGTIIYVPNKHKQNNYQVFSKYSLRVIYRDNEFGLLISFIGNSYLLNSSWNNYPQITDDLATKVLYKKQVSRYSNVSSTYSPVKSDVTLFLNRGICKILGITIPIRSCENKYLEFYDKIIALYKSDLSGIKIQNTFQLSTQGLKRVQECSIRQISEKSNLLRFGNGRTNFNVYTGLKEYGPFEVPQGLKPKFFFIFHKDDKDVANRLFACLSKGIRHFPGLSQFINIPISIDNLDTSISIQYTNENPVDEIRDKLEANSEKFSKYNYFAFYLSRISKDEEAETQHSIYYQIKRLLLLKEVPSQVVYRDKILSENFSFFLPNIAVSVLAKLGGKPWEIFTSNTKSLIVGIAAHRSKGYTYVGNAIAFQNDGSFEEFEAFPESNLSVLGNIFSSQLSKYAKRYKEISKIIIHFYKTMNHEEEKVLLACLEKNDLKIPYIVLSVSDAENREHLIFDEEYPGKMPRSGSFVQIGLNEYLVCNNSRYDKATSTKIREYPFPIYVKFSKYDEVGLFDRNARFEVIEQIYQFSRIYWRSVTQTGEPVTIKYSKIIAEMASHFGTDALPDNNVARRKLWFL
jgi:hypothetical protein